MITLSSQDNQLFKVRQEIAERSMLLKNILEDLGDTSDTTIPLPNVSGRILQRTGEGSGFWCIRGAGGSNLSHPPSTLMGGFPPAHLTGILYRRNGRISQIKGLLLANITLVVEYCTHHKDDPQPPPSDIKEDFDTIRRRADDISEWDTQFINIENDDIFELILAANYMDIKPLLDLGCMTVANRIRGKSPEEIRTAFNIENDFTPEEEEQIRVGRYI
ncbi:hypothetical protein BSLG_009240 [Batrachochytrium salamandrivorans]|nr:hypothetical protein BSLG_009240 [Batrachochytrium salamandrivorans]